MHTNTHVRVRGIIIYEGEILVVKHRKDDDFYALPGGHLEYGESVLECIKREMLEELGVTPVVGKLLYVNNFMDKKDDSQSIEFFFEITNGADYKNTSNLEKTHAFEIVELVWVKQSDDVKILPMQVGTDFKNGEIGKRELKFTS